MLRPVQWWLVTAPMDLRGGMDRLLVHVRTALGRDPFDGSAYVFRNRSGSRLKVLHGMRRGSGCACGVWLCTGVDWRRLSQVPMFALPPRSAGA